MRAGTGLSSARPPALAAREAAEAALATGGIARAEAAVVLATADHAAEAPALLQAASDVLGCEAVVGASVHGLLGDGREEDSGVAVLALAGIEALPFLFPDLAGHEHEVGPEVAWLLGGAPSERDLVVLLPDPSGFDPRALLGGLDAALAPALRVGAGAAQAAGVASLQWCRGEIARGGLSGLVLRAPAPPRIGVTQSCRPVSEIATVTRAEGHWVLELDGRPALDVYREIARAPLAADLRRAATFLLVAVPRDPAAPLAPGAYLVRHVVGFAEARRAFALPEPVAKGQTIAFVLRDAQSARDDLLLMLDGLVGPRPPAFGLYFDCCARGASLFGVSGLESAYLARAFGAAPIAGLLGSCEIGPIGGRTELLTYTGLLVLVDEA